MLILKVWVETKKGNSFECSLPAKRIVCPACDGSGTELRGGLKGAVISDENLADPDFRESYFGGEFDTQCSECQGLNVIVAVDEEQLSPKMLERYFRAIDSAVKSDREYAAEQRYFERAMGER